MIQLTRKPIRLLSSLLACLSVVTIFLPGTRAQADMITLNNPDFELGSPAPPSAGAGGTSYVGNIPGWNVVNSGGVFEPDFVSEVAYPAASQATTGNYTAYSQSNTFGLVSQLLPSNITLQADSTYVLSVDIGHRSGEAFSGGFGFYRLTNPFATGISLKAAVDPGAGNFSRQTHTLRGADIPVGDLGNPFRIGFFANPGFIVDFDNVTLSISAIPEPTALTLTATGLLLIITRRRRS